MYVTKVIYMRASSRYQVMTYKEPSAHSGRFAMFYREAEHFTMEALRRHVVNAVGFQIESGSKRWYAAGCYLVPDNALTL